MFNIPKKKQFRRQNAVGNVLVMKFTFTSTEAKIIALFKSYCYQYKGAWGGVTISHFIWVRNQEITAS